MESAPTSPRTVILYHTNCPDGFGGAYAAWKKFGDTVEYIPVQHGKPAPEGLAGANLIFIDFCYPQDIMDELVRIAASVVVLDHHEGTRAVVESMPEHIFDNDRSGATIAWSYFHPGTSVPALLKYVEDGDLYRFTLPESHAVLAYLYIESFSFERWTEFQAELEDPAQFAKALELGRIYEKHYGMLTSKIADAAELVEFEGHTVYLASCIRLFTSDVGSKLYRKQPPFAVIASVRADGLRVSLRGNGDVDLSAVAQKFGGNGHRNAAAFSLPFDAPVPWTPAPKSNDSAE